LVVAASQINLRKHAYAPNRSNISSWWSIENRYRIVIFLMSWLSTHMCNFYPSWASKGSSPQMNLCSLSYAPSESVLRLSPLELHSPLDSSGSVGGWIGLLQGSNQCDVRYLSWVAVRPGAHHDSLKFFRHRLHLLKNFNCWANFFFDY